WEGLAVSIEPNPKAFVNDDLFLNVVDAGDSLVLDLDYNTDLLDVSTADRWLGYFEKLLLEIAADPARPLAALPMWTDAERDRVLIEWNRTGRPPSVFAHAGGMIEAQAAATPSAVAASFREHRLTYEEPNAR